MSARRASAFCLSALGVAVLGLVCSSIVQALQESSTPSPAGAVTGSLGFWFAVIGSGGLGYYVKPAIDYFSGRSDRRVKEQSTLADGYKTLNERIVLGFESQIKMHVDQIAAMKLELSQERQLGRELRAEMDAKLVAEEKKAESSAGELDRIRIELTNSKNGLARAEAMIESQKQILERYERRVPK